MNEQIFYMDNSEFAMLPPGKGDSPEEGPGPRIHLLLQQALSRPPRLSIERARYFTDSLRGTEGLPLVLRWARALVHVMANIGVHILPEESIVGRIGGEGRYGIFYPELEGTYFSRGESISIESMAYIAPEDLPAIRDEIVPYWTGRTYREGLAAELSPELKKLLYTDDDIFASSFIIVESATIRHSLQWALDYNKIMTRGFRGIEQDAAQRLARLPAVEEPERSDRHAFYLAVIELCQGIRHFAERYAHHAELLAAMENDFRRKNELLEIAARCRRVPYSPPRDFAEAVQAQWFTQLVSRFEQSHGGNIANGRIDQYLYPLYRQGLDEGTLTPARAREYLDALWCCMAQFLRLQITPSGAKIYQDHAHWEFTTIGGRKPDGSDAANELSSLILASASDFPLDYPYLGVRIHKNTPSPFLREISQTIRKGKGIPVLLNDEEIIPLLAARGASESEALDYCGSGVSEVRLINRNTYMTGSTWLNLVAVLEMALSDGRCSTSPTRRVGVSTGDANTFRTFEDLWEAFERQLAHVQSSIFEQQRIADRIRTRHVAAPLLSSLHDLCMEHGIDVNHGKLPGAIASGGFTGVVGFATVVDSLAAIRSIVFEERAMTMDHLLEIIAANFEEHEIVRQRCLRCPKFGNMDGAADEIGKRIDRLLVSMCRNERNHYGGMPEIFYVPVTAHIAMGRVSGATPNGRRAGEMLSYGISPSQGCDMLGPTALLTSLAATKNPDLQPMGARVVRLVLSPQNVAGETGLEALTALIRSWCAERHWFLQVYLYSQADLAVLRNNPEKFRNVLLRAPGLDFHHPFLTNAVIEEAFSAAPPHPARRPLPPQEKTMGRPARSFSVWPAEARS